VQVECSAQVAKGKYYQRGTEFTGQAKSMVPTGKRALKWINAYQYQARPELTLGNDDGTLFVTKMGGAFHANL